MFRRGSILVVLIGLFVFGLLGVGGYAGWSQGFDAGLVAGAQGEVPAYVPYAIGFSPVFLGVALFFKVALMFLILFGIFRMFRFFAWRTAGGPQSGPWGRHGRGHHHPHRRRDREQDSEDEAEETERDSESGSPRTRA